MPRRVPALLAYAALSAGAALAPGPSAAACPPAGWPVEQLHALRARQWALDAAPRQALAVVLIDCLRDPDPVRRDEIAFEALQAWMRAGALPPATLRELTARLSLMLDAPDSAGFGAPFAALTLAEVARTDRITAWWSDEERRAHVALAARWLAGWSDRRGFDPRTGWRHGVAHGADWALQLGLNPALDRPALDALLAALARQAVPPGDHAYIHGEGERLARAVLAIARRGVHGEAEWSAWLGGIAAAATPATGEVTDLAALARAHNARQLLWPLQVALSLGSDTALRERLGPGLAAALRALP